MITFINAIDDTYVTNLGANGVLLEGSQLYTTGTENGPLGLYPGQQGTAYISRFGTGPITFTGMVFRQCDNKLLGYAVFTRPSGSSYGYNPYDRRYEFDRDGLCEQRSATWIITSCRAVTPVEQAVLPPKVQSEYNGCN